MNARLMGKRSVAVALVALSFIVMAVATSPAQALSMDAGVGDIYMVSTICGKAWARVGDEIVEVPVTVELTCEVTETFSDAILFKPISGSIVLNGTVYEVNQAWWRGIYVKHSERALIQGSASNEEGDTLHFILHTKDREHTQGGTFMKALGGIRDPNCLYWKTELLLWRYKLN